MGNYQFKLPDVGEGIAQAELVEINVKVGDIVREDMVLAEFMTDKATVEIPSPVEGRVMKIHGKPGDVLSIGSVFIEISYEGEGSAQELAVTDSAAMDAEDMGDETVETMPLSKAMPQSEPEPNEKSDDQPTRTVEVTKRSNLTETQDKVLASPAVRKRAKALGIDLVRIRSSDKEIISHADLDQFLSDTHESVQDSTSAISAKFLENAGGDPSGGEKIIGLRRKISNRMSQANIEVPHITIIEDLDVTALLKLRTKINETKMGEGKRNLTLLPFVMKAICLALQEFPKLNAHYYTQAQTLEQFEQVHIGVATQTKSGLMVPVVRDAQNKTLDALSEEMNDVVEKTRNGSATVQELAGSTITITSLGKLGAVATTPIINQPEVAIIGINKIFKHAHWDGESFIPRDFMHLSSSFDHRVIDGWDAAQFVASVKTLLEDPITIFV